MFWLSPSITIVHLRLPTFTNPNLRLNMIDYGLVMTSSKLVNRRWRKKKEEPPIDSIGRQVHLVINIQPSVEQGEPDVGSSSFFFHQPSVEISRPWRWSIRLVTEGLNFTFQPFHFRSWSTEGWSCSRNPRSDQPKVGWNGWKVEKLITLWKKIAVPKKRSFKTNLRLGTILWTGMEFSFIIY